MAASVELWSGPARSGKTSRLLELYRHALGQSPPGGCLWLAPNHRAARDVRSRLLCAQLPGCFSPSCQTFGRFADNVLRASRLAFRPVTPLYKRQLVQRLLNAAAERNELLHFGSIAQTAGLVSLVEGFISELKKLEIWPEHFAEACHARRIMQQDRELLAIYEGYQRLLNEHQLYDAEGRFWSARHLLREGQTAPYENLRTVLVDGFHDLTRTQHEILEILAQRVDRLIVTLPLDIHDQRDGLFGKSRRTRDEFLRRHPHAHEVAFEQLPAEMPAAVAHLAAEMFGNPRTTTPLSEQGEIEVVAATGALGEIQQVARRIKRLLVLGDGTGPVPSEDILVVFRSLTAAAPLVREVFRSYGIPIELEATRALQESPAIAALLAALRCAVEDWPFRQLLALLGNNYFRPAWPQWQGESTLVAAEQTLRRLQLPRGRAELLRQLERLGSSSDGAGSDELTVDGQTVTSADQEATAELDGQERRAARQRRQQQAVSTLALLQRLGAAFGKLPRHATALEWVGALRSLAEDLGLLAAMEDAQRQTEHSASDCAAWDMLLSLLGASGTLNQWLDEPQTSIARDDLFALLADISASESLPSDSQHPGGVRVLSASSARTLAAPYVFIAGMTEKAFPPADADDRLYSDAEYQRLISAGLCLVARDQRSQEEMLLFYETVTRATRRLCLSYPAIDEKGQELSPSPYLEEVIRVCGRDKIALQRVIELTPVPDAAADPMRGQDLRLHAVARALERRPQCLEQISLGRELWPHSAAPLWAGLRVVQDRARFGQFGAFEGLLPSAAAQQALARQYGPHRRWNASLLESYASCPYRFFLQTVLRVDPLDEIRLQTDHAARGKMIHAALRRIHQQTNLEAGQPQSPGKTSADQLQAAFVEVLELLVQQRAYPPLTAALAEVDRRLLLQWSAEYLQQHLDYDQASASFETPLTPAYFEVAFGDASLADSPADPARATISTHLPFKLQVGGETVELAGRIDRIDVGRAAGRTVFNVIDYKSGSSAKLKTDDIANGLALQLPLYAMAVEQLLLAEQNAAPWSAGYWLVKGSGFDSKNAVKLHQIEAGKLAVTDQWQSLSQSIVEKVGQLIQGIRGAQFPVYSADEHCTGRCPFKTVCRVGQIRALEKVWPPEK